MIQNQAEHLLNFGAAQGGIVLGDIGAMIQVLEFDMALKGAGLRVLAIPFDPLALLVKHIEHGWLTNIVGQAQRTNRPVLNFFPVPPA